LAVREAPDGRRALQLIETETPDAVVLDVGIPGLTSFVLCRLLRERFGERLPIILVSGERVEAFDRTAGLLLGADDYVVKPFDEGEVLARVQRFISRSREESTSASDSFGAVNERQNELTRREREVLALLVEGLNQSEIAHELVISPNTVATHIQRILIKLGVHNRAQAVAFAAREGLVGTGAASRFEGGTSGSEGDVVHRVTDLRPGRKSA
jgi:NarL family two-component system response regulator LiaR